jgi:acyl-CoA reductase-like NAD-dependent aldehyde dehydrogenase
MTTIQVTLPDDLVRKATEAGLLSAEAIQDMLRERLLRRAGESLREIHGRMPGDELTPQIEQEIFQAVQAYRAERRARRMG